MSRGTTRRELIPGPVGSIECAIDTPAGPLRGLALVAHPHPLYGGTLDNKVVQTLARSLTELGYLVLRPNLRGVGASEGAFDGGPGECDDLLATLEYAGREFGALHPASPPVLAGFSFGAAVQTQVADRLASADAAPGRMLLVGVAVKHFEARPVPRDSIVIHGEKDETVLLADVLDWARPQDLPITVVPGADHFFHRRLHVLRGIVQYNWQR
jgi:alpha/beta superfamily hydrolase